MSRARSGPAAVRGRVPGPGGVFTLADGLLGPGLIPVDEAIDLVLAEWALAAGRGDIAASTVETHGKVVETLRKFAKVKKLQFVDDLDSVALHSWYSAPAARTGELPTVTMVALRQSVARSMYRTLAFLGITDRDITVAVPALRKPARAVRPLTEAQVQSLKKAAVLRRREHSGSAKGPATLALALLGLQSKEIPATLVSDIDFPGGTVWAHDGGVRYAERFVPIDDAWAWQALAERVQFLQRTHGVKATSMSVAYEVGKTRGGSAPKNQAASTSNQLDEIFKHAGVKQPGRIRLASLNEYVAKRVYAETGSFVEVAARLGMRSLDAVAHIVDEEWLNRRLAEGIRKP